MSEYLEKLVAPVHEFNALTADNLEKLAELQLQTADKTVKAWTESVKGAAAVRDMEGLRTYVTEQTEAGKALADELFAGTRSAVALGQGYFAGVRELTESCMQSD